MEVKNMGKFKKPNFTLVLVVLICIFITAGIVSAASQISANKGVYLKVANDDGARFNIYNDSTYHFFKSTQAEGTGLNSLHISSSINKLEGDTTKTNSLSGTFYFTETGTRGWDDNGILMIAVNGTPENLEDISIRINSAGYQWTPVLTGYYPDYSTTTYNSSAMNETFTWDDFNGANGYYSYWKPCSTANYPLYEDQNVTEDTTNSNVFYIIFVDLKAGIIGNHTLLSETWDGQNAVNNGALKADYTISGLPEESMVTFNSYAYCSSSNMGQGIRWTNSVNIAGNNSATTSGWKVASWLNSNL